MIPIRQVQILAHESYQIFLLKDKSIDELMKMAFKRNPNKCMTSSAMIRLSMDQYIGVDLFRQCKRDIIKLIIE